jgi:hypothetical protein
LNGSANGKRPGEDVRETESSQADRKEDERCQ